ncbi:hypothetical protein MASR2M48_24080 [Spirochaetota bacterium]
MFPYKQPLVVVVDVVGSSPRHPGSRMIVFPDGSFLGTVGGGIVEASANKKAVEAIASRTPSLLKFEMTGKEALGSEPICGGAITLAILPRHHALASLRRLPALPRGTSLVMVHALSPDATQGSGYLVAVRDAAGRLVYSTGNTIDDLAADSTASGSPVISAQDGYLYDPIAPVDRLLILGAGHVGQALARFAVNLDFSVCVADSRPEFASPSRFPSGVETRTGDFTTIVDDYAFGDSTYVVVVGPSHSSDLECARAILKREYRYAGIIGSKRKARMILDQAIAEGFPPQKVNDLRTPIGADIGAETPSEIAVSILAEIIAVRRSSPGILAIDKDRETRR